MGFGDDLGAGVRGGVRGGMNAESYAERGVQSKDGGSFLPQIFADDADERISLGEGKRQVEATGPALA